MEMFNHTAVRRQLGADKLSMSIGHMDHELHRSGTFCLAKHLAPLVMLLGCQRCGTSSFYDAIMDHVHGARKGHSLHSEPDYYGREQHFFATDTWSRGPRHYLDHFPSCPAKGNSGLAFAVDATPAYLRKPIVATRIKEVYPSPALPRLKFILLLRDPARRLYAYWDTFVLSGNGVNNFATWVDATLPKVLACQRQHGPALWPPPDEGRCDEDTVEGVAAGLYAYQLQYWFHQFDPQQFFITSLDAYERDASRVLRDAALFIGAPGNLEGTPRQIGTAYTQAMKVSSAMPEKAKTALGKFYHPHNQQLVRLLNGEPRVHFSPSIKQLEISGWFSG